MTSTNVLPEIASPTVRASVERFVRFLETGAIEGLFAPDLFADLTFPQWRIQVQGADEVVAARNRMHPPPGRTRVERVLGGPDSYTIKVEERWVDDRQKWYCREAFLCSLDADGLITEFSLYCTGDWDEALVARHAATVTLPRP